ncbi:hypothetical protein C8F04DRAFT_1192259 [Mycena alexandri]|uniref:Uncharacterized protein n=1 Tax=Mycena alexandri TaxID=1745969 RepID=A0AAD6SCQ7_9AGAR|nr:hypothetical protein C8F04DRAFT_1192259 [Mycena alexandri]
MTTTDLTMSVVLSPVTIIRSVQLDSMTPRTFAPASISSIPSAVSPAPTIPSAFFGPWFLTKYGVLVLDRLTGKNSSRAFEQSEDGYGSTRASVFEQADSPCFAASDFETIIAFLPRVPDLANNFRRVGGRFKQCRALYFIVEEHNKIFTSALDAQLFHIETGDSTLGIYVFPSRAQAEDMVEFDASIYTAGA